MLTGLWISLLGFALVPVLLLFLGLGGILAGFIVVMIGGAILAKGYEVLTRAPPASPPPT